MPTYAGRSYFMHDEMLQSMVRRWLRENDVASKRTPVMAEECAAAWHLADGHMEVESYDIEHLMRAFAQVMVADGRDRRAEARRGIVTPRETSPPKGGRAIRFDRAQP